MQFFVQTKTSFSQFEIRYETLLGKSEAKVHVYNNYDVSFDKHLIDKGNTVEPL